MSDLLELETRRKIYKLILKHPGLHLSKIASLLNLRISLIEYHLLYLEKKGIAFAVKEGGYKRYYVKEKMGVGDRKVLALLRQEIPLKIVLYLLKNPHSRHKEILQVLSIAPSTLTYHLKKLVERNIIACFGEGDKRGYIVRNEEEVVALLLRYKPYNVIENFRDVWKDFLVE
jgi:predicted transcriptional regulator